MSDGSAQVRRAKAELRRRLLAARAARSGHDRASAETALCRGALALCRDRGARTVCCYYSTDEEPGTHALVDALVAAGVLVLLPVLRADLDLDWAPYLPGSLRAGRFGIAEPVGERLGLEAVTSADVVICPGLAADRAGRRLGRGGGSYDRALARLGGLDGLGPSAPLRVVVLYDDEVLAVVPADDHDQPVDVAVTPGSTLILRQPPHEG